MPNMDGIISAKQMMTTTTRCLTTDLANRFTRVPPFELYLIIEHCVDFINV